MTPDLPAARARAASLWPGFGAYLALVSGAKLERTTLAFLADVPNETREMLTFHIEGNDHVATRSETS